jgi:hypothetical protein
MFTKSFLQTKTAKCQNIFPANEPRFLPNAPTQNLIQGNTIALFAILVTRVASIRTYCHFFPHFTNGALVQSSVTDTGYVKDIRYNNVFAREISGSDGGEYDD